MRRRRVDPFQCRLCRSWSDQTDAGVSRGELADGTPYILCGGCSRRFAASSAPEREQLVQRIREVVSEMEILA